MMPYYVFIGTWDHKEEQLYHKHRWQPDSGWEESKDCNKQEEVRAVTTVHKDIETTQDTAHWT